MGRNKGVAKKFSKRGPDSLGPRKKSYTVEKFHDEPKDVLNFFSNIDIFYKKKGTRQLQQSRNIFPKKLISSSWQKKKKIG